MEDSSPDRIKTAAPGRRASTVARYSFVLLPLAHFAGLYAGRLEYERRIVAPLEVFSFNRLDFVVSLLWAIAVAICGGLIYALDRLWPRLRFVWFVGVVLCATFSFWVGTGLTASMVF